MALRSKPVLLALSTLVTAAATVLSLPTLSLATSPSPPSTCSNARTPEGLFLADITALGFPCAGAWRLIVPINEHRRDLKYLTTRYAGSIRRQDVAAAWIRCNPVIRCFEGT